MRSERVVLLTVALTLGLATTPIAQKGGGKPKPPPDQSATATFRCAGFTTTCGSDGSPVPDSITGDGGAYVGVGDTITGSGAFIRSLGGDFELQTRPAGGRLVYLNFEHQAVPPSGTFFRKTFTRATLNGIAFNTNVIDPATGEEAADGVRSIPVGSSWPARIKANWTDPYGVLYTIRFNPDSYPGSTYVTVTRLAETIWEVEASNADLARLVSPDGPGGGKRGPTDEGLYWMPFKITVTVP